MPDVPLSSPGDDGLVERTQALLLTDVVDSTKLSEAIGDAAMARVWAAHDRVARDLLPPWRGLEIDKTDGMLLLFEHAADAVAYAQAYHAGLADIAATLPFGMPWPLRARAGLHVGPVILRRNAPEDVARGAKPLEVDGLAKPIAARVMSVARGGQTLLTPQALAGLGEAGAGQPVALQSHGHWMLKGVADPVELTEVGPDPAVFAAPPDGDKAWRVVQVEGRWLPVREVPGNLPQQTSSFVGRERELHEIKTLLGRQRLVTLLGMGGLGKTRLILQVAAELRADFPDGTWFIDLSPLRDEALVASEAAQTLGVREEPGRSRLHSIVAHLAGRRALLLFDNCEHLVHAAAELAHALVRGAPGVRLLASSRELLRVPGEHAYPVHPLPLPGRRDGLPALRRLAAVQLFEQRAQAQRPDWALTEAEAPAVAELVQRLEGIPLALELAAARVRVLPVAEINRRLDDRYKLLTGGSRVLQQRQQTLRALVDWSYELLQPEEQRLFQRLGVFVGGFDLAAAEAVCADETLDSLDVLDLLGSLVDKSLVIVEAQAAGHAPVSTAEHRYRLLETLREYAAARLAQAGTAERDAAAARHCGHFFALAKQGREGMQGPGQRQWLDRLELEQDNLRAAIALAQTGGAGVDPFVALKMAVALQNFWVMRGGAREGRAVVAAMLALPVVQASAMACAHALYVGSALAWTQGDQTEALQMLQQCLELRRGLDAPNEVAATLSTLAVTRLSGGELEAARDAAAEAVRLFRQIGRRVGEAIALLQLGQVQTQCGDLAQAQALLQQALALAREIKHPETEGEVELALGLVAAERGDLAAAGAHCDRALAVCTAAGDQRGEAHARWAQGSIAVRAGEPGQALPLLHEAFRAFDDFEMRASWTGCVEDLAAVALAAGHAELAASLAAAAQRVRDDTQLARSPQAGQRHAALLQSLQLALGQPAFDTATTTGRGWDLVEIRRQALAVACPPIADMDMGRPPQ